MRKVYVTPTEYAYEEYPRHFTKGRRYLVVGEYFRTDTGLRLSHIIGEKNMLTVEAHMSNTTGGKLL